MSTLEARQAAAAMARGSRTFSLAAVMFPAHMRQDVAILYRWLRECDDAVDLGPPAERAGSLARIREQLEAALGGQPGISQ